MTFLLIILIKLLLCKNSIVKLIFLVLIYYYNLLKAKWAFNRVIIKIKKLLLLIKCLNL